MLIPFVAVIYLLMIYCLLLVIQHFLKTNDSRRNVT